MKNVLFSQIVNSKIASISRACDLVCIEFNSNKNISLHIQCFFRFLMGNHVLICSDDMFRCDEKYDATAFEWDVPGTSAYDVLLKKYRHLIVGPEVRSITQNDIGDLSILFQNGLELQVIINTTEPEEKYRMFDDTLELIIDK